MKVKEITEGINRQAASRGARAVNALRSAELYVLKGQRSGKVYRKPYTKKATYTASAPGEAPARRTGNLRLHWNGNVKVDGNSKNGVTVLTVLESQEKYAVYPEKGIGMAPRPFVDRIIQKAEPEVTKIYMKPYG
ncbi:MAG: hypothetical protein HFH73_07800 [Lachnospiraceae bacterium]|jgi:hypothetical protein|nr:hypothetical protein [Lachnospiraceae bacterium]